MIDESENSKNLSKKLNYAWKKLAIKYENSIKELASKETFKKSFENGHELEKESLDLNLDNNKIIFNSSKKVKKHSLK